LICLDCGKSKVAVIDADSVEGHGVDGLTTLLDLELKNGFLPETLMAQTPSGGRHYVFSDPDGKMKSTAGVLGPGVDTRGVGGMIVLAPSVVKGKGAYAWLNSLPKAKLPQWVIDGAGAVKERGVIRDAEFEPAYTEEQFAERLALIDVEQFSGKHDEWLSFMLACTHSSTVADGKAAFIAWTTKNGEGEYACDVDPIEERWYYNYRNRNMGGRASKVGTFNKYLSDAGHDDMVLLGNETEAADDFGDDDTDDLLLPPNGEKQVELDHDKIKRKIRALLTKTTKAGCAPEEATSALAKARELMAAHGVTEDDLAKKKKRDRLPTSATMDDFYAFLPEHAYMFVPTRKLWPAATINSILGEGGAAELDRLKPVHEMAWCPGKEMIVRDKLVFEGGWLDKPGRNTFNTYMAPPVLKGGDAKKAQPWLDHVRKVYPDDADHLVKWLAHRMQFPEIKINHGLILGSDKHGIGKDTILEPMVRALGAWNVKDVSAAQSMDPKFNPFLESLICRINEASDLGDDDRFNVYNRRKTWMASPPATLSVADKNVKIHPVENVTGIIISANEKGGLYLPAEDRRHYVAWSDCVPGDFEQDAVAEDSPDHYWTKLHRWYDEGGVEHVAAYLTTLDLSRFNPKAPHPKTAAFWEIVNSGQSTEASELADLLDYVDAPFGPPAVVTIEQLTAAAAEVGTGNKFDEIFTWLQDRRSRRSIPHRLNKCGYAPVRNEADTNDGQWRVGGRRVTIYGRKDLPVRARIDAAQALVVATFNSERKARATRELNRAVLAK
jgi:hypothetical protein